jgi:competence protein ComEC
VGQGDSAFIKTPENHQIIIDGGPDSSVLAEISKIMPFWDRTIDLVILSHPEKDHMQGLLEIFKKYKADYILWTGVEKIAPEYDKWVNVLSKQQKNGAKIIIAEAGQEIKVGNVLINALLPFESMEGLDIGSSANDTCVVNKIIYGRNSFLFTGDISSVVEKELIISGENISSNVLKIAHHGSKYSTSEEFLQAVNPKTAVIGVGENSYGHPTAEVLQRLEKFGIQVLRTDTNGTVKFVSDGNDIKLIN